MHTGYHSDKTFAILIDGVMVVAGPALQLFVCMCVSPPSVCIQLSFHSCVELVIFSLKSFVWFVFVLFVLMVTVRRWPRL